ncbi:hypothetical protein [Streptomyces anthocyanicus]|nr:hypothetical protein OH747_40090 [Streptomyces anthocyanicus]
MLGGAARGRIRLLRKVCMTGAVKMAVPSALPDLRVITEEAPA